MKELGDQATEFKGKNNRKDQVLLSVNIISEYIHYFLNLLIKVQNYYFRAAFSNFQPIL